LIGIKSESLKEKGSLKVFYLTKVEGTKIETPGEVLITTFCGVRIDLMSRSTASAGDNEEFALHLEPFIRVAMSTEK
jgi:hypothetical protein